MGNESSIEANQKSINHEPNDVDRVNALPVPSTVSLLLRDNGFKEFFYFEDVQEVMEVVMQLLKGTGVAEGFSALCGELVDARTKENDGSTGADATTTMTSPESEKHAIMRNFHVVQQELVKETARRNELKQEKMDLKKQQENLLQRLGAVSSRSETEAENLEANYWMNRQLPLSGRDVDTTSCVSSLRSVNTLSDSESSDTNTETSGSDSVSECESEDLMTPSEEVTRCASIEVHKLFETSIDCPTTQRLQASVDALLEMMNQE